MNIESTSPAGFVLHELTWSVRVLTAEQLRRMLVARHGPSVSTRSLTRSLRAEDLVSSTRVAVAFYEASERIASRSLGQTVPNLGALAWQLEKRWRNVCSRRVTIFWATQRAARLFGGVANFDRHASQLEHDLGTASILVRYHESYPELADRWVGEDILRRDFAPHHRSMSKIPDAAVVLKNRIVRVIEFGGQYSARRLRRFDAHFHNKHSIPYDVW